MECYGDDDQFFMRHRKAPPSIDISILAGDASVGYALFDYGLTLWLGQILILMLEYEMLYNTHPMRIEITNQQLKYVRVLHGMLKNQHLPYGNLKTLQLIQKSLQSE